jgi:hypothetical protein
MRFSRERGLALLPLLAALTCLVAAAAADGEPEYRISYDARIVPSTKTAAVKITVGQSRSELLLLRFQIDPERQRRFAGDGEVVVSGNTVEWKPPSTGGTLRYDFLIDQLRDAGSYDARCAADWAIFRGDDLVPPAAATTQVGARSNAHLRIRAPEGWSVVTRYAPGDGSVDLNETGRRFVRPSGWIVAGSGMGVLRERIAGTRVSVAAPAGQGVRRLDILALLRWTLPKLEDVLGSAAERLLVVGAGDPMWRGGLSGPSSLFIHADRPLITPDSTSPILHEVLHASLRLKAAPGDDWIVEGLAEYYSLELLVRSKTISRSRYERALEELADDGKAAGSLSTDRASGAVTDRAVTVLHALDEEIRSASDGAQRLDDVVRALMQEPSRVVSRSLLRREAERAAGASLEAFFERHDL